MNAMDKTALADYAKYISVNLGYFRMNINVPVDTGLILKYENMF